MRRTDFIRALPKAELHMHLEGSLEPGMMFDLARRNGVGLPYRTVSDVRDAYRFDRLQDFLPIYYQGMAVLTTEQDFFDLTLSYFRRAAGDNVRHAEVFFDPQGHTSRGVPFKVVIDGITAARAEAEKSLGVTSYLILSFLRHLTEEDAFETLAVAEPYLDRIIGVGLDSTELGHPPAKFAGVFARARAAGLKLCAHAGEEGPPEFVIQALDVLAIDRLDHGNRAMEDAKLVHRLSDNGMTLTVCPLSNLKLGVTSTMAESPVRSMLEHGLAVTVNSDDPAYFGGYINANFDAVADALDLTLAELATLAGNSFHGSFLPDGEKSRHLNDVEAVAARARVNR